MRIRVGLPAARLPACLPPPAPPPACRPPAPARQIGPASSVMPRRRALRGCYAILPKRRLKVQSRAAQRTSHQNPERDAAAVHGRRRKLSGVAGDGRADGACGGGPSGPTDRLAERLTRAGGRG